MAGHTGGGCGIFFCQTTSERRPVEGRAADVKRSRAPGSQSGSRAAIIRKGTPEEADGRDRDNDVRERAIWLAASPRAAPASVPRSGSRVGVSRRPFPSRPGQHPLRLPGGDLPLGRVGPAPAPLHAGPVRPETRHGHAVRRVHPHADRRPRAHLHAVLRARLGMGVGRHRGGDDPVLGLLRLADLHVAPGVRLRRRHPDHGVHLHAAATTVRPGHAGHGDRHRLVPPLRPHRPVHRPRESGAGDALPGLLRLAGRAGRLSDGTPHARSVPARTPARSGTGAIRRAAAQHAARSHRRTAQDLRRRTDRPELRSGQRVLRRRGGIDGTGGTVLPGGVRRCPG